MDHNFRIAAPPPTQTVMANAKPSKANSRLRTSLRAAKLALRDGLERTREETKGRRDGPRERERLSA